MLAAHLQDLCMRTLQKDQADFPLLEHAYIAEGLSSHVLRIFPCNGLSSEFAINYEKK